MAIEQRPLSEPVNRESPLTPLPVDRSRASSIESISQGIMTILPVVDKFATDKILSRLDAEVETTLADTTFDTIDLENAETLTPDQTRTLLETDPGTANFVREIDALAASQRQGRGAKGQLDRADSVVKKFINEFPGRETEIREHAQNALGLKQGVQAALESAREDEAFQRSVERSIKQSFVQRAIDEGQGYVSLFQDGSVDIETTANRGRILLTLDEQLGFRQTGRGRGVVGTGGGVALSLAERDDLEVRDMQGYQAERFRQFLPGLTSQLRALVNNPEFVGNGIAQMQEIQRSLALQRESEIQNMELKYRGIFGDKAIDETISFVNDTFDRLDGLADTPADQLADQITVLDNSAKLRAHTLLPTLMTLKEAGLGDSLNAMSAVLLALTTDELQNTIANEIKAVTRGTSPIRIDDVINDVGRTAKDGKPFASMSQESRNKAIQLSAGFMNELVRNRNSLDLTQKNAFLNLFTQTAVSGTQVQSTKALNNAVKIFAQAGYAETLSQISTDPDLKEKADIAGQIANNLALKAFHRTAPEIQKGLARKEAFGIVYDPTTERLEFRILAGFRIFEKEEEIEVFGPPDPVPIRGILPRALRRARGLPLTRPPDPRITRPSPGVTGQEISEIVAERIGAEPALTRRGIDILRGIGRSRETVNFKDIERLKGMNNALNVLTAMKEFSIYRNSYAGLSDRQIKEQLAASQGFPIKGGRSSSLGGISDEKIEELKDVGVLQSEQTGTNVTEIDRVFTFDPSTDSFTQQP